jgi:predicted TIM-barrel fold metal-dependent hydrolase
MQIFDSHLHIIDPQFPLVPNQGYLPSDFTVQDYLKRVKHLPIIGGAVVSGSFQAFDQTYLIAALKELGPSFVGVTQLPASVSDEEIISLHKAGVRAIRFNCKRGGSEGVEKMESFARRVYALARWHVELYIDSRDLPSISPILLKLPKASVDHLGLSKEGFSHLLALVEQGIKVKATGFGRIDFDVSWGLKEIAKANPDALLFGTDLPSTRSPRPFSDQDIRLILDAFDERQAKKILYSNAVEFYAPTTKKLP